MRQAKTFSPLSYCLSSTLERRSPPHVGVRLRVPYLWRTILPSLFPAFLILFPFRSRNSFLPWLSPGCWPSALLFSLPLLATLSGTPFLTVSFFDRFLQHLRATSRSCSSVCKMAHVRQESATRRSFYRRLLFSLASIFLFSPLSSSAIHTPFCLFLLLPLFLAVLLSRPVTLLLSRVRRLHRP